MNKFISSAIACTIVPIQLQELLNNLRLRFTLDIHHLCEESCNQPSLAAEISDDRVRDSVLAKVTVK